MLLLCASDRPSTVPKSPIQPSPCQIWTIKTKQKKREREIQCVHSGLFQLFDARTTAVFIQIWSKWCILDTPGCTKELAISTLPHPFVCSLCEFLLMPNPASIALRFCVEALKRFSLGYQIICGHWLTFYLKKATKTGLSVLCCSYLPYRHKHIDVGAYAFDNGMELCYTKSV